MTPLRASQVETLRLTRSQRCVLKDIAAMEAHGEDGHNFSGDLSRWTGNLTLTMRRLEKRGLVKGTYEPMAMEGEEWTYRLTQLGKEALASSGKGAGE